MHRQRGRVKFLSARSDHEHFEGQHRFEHWYRDNRVYFITARCRDKYPAFDSVEAQLVFWDRFEHPNTKVRIDLERGLRRALQLKAFLPMVPYKRYEH